MRGGFWPRFGSWAALRPTIVAMRSLAPVWIGCAVVGAAWPTAAAAEVSPLALRSLRSLAAQPAEIQTPQPTSSRAPSSTAPQPTSSKAPGSTGPATPPQPTSSKAPGSTVPQPTSSKAPGSTTPTPGPEPAPQPEVADDLDQLEGDDDLTLEDERDKAVIDQAFHRHAIGAHAGLSVIPTWLLSSFLASHTNALCRGTTVGAFAGDRGLNKQDGCNFYVGADYTFRFSRVLDIAASVQYQRAKVPDGLWLDKNRYDGSAASLESAHYTEIDLGLLAMEVDFIARAPVVVTKDVEFGIGGGAGLGLGVVLGGVWQTPLGASPEGFTADGGRTPGSCQTLDDLADLTRCTPRYDINEDGDMVPPDQSELSAPNPDLFARCTSDECNESDLRAFGYRQKQGGVPPVIPVVNLIVSARLIIKDVVGLTLNGGFNTGFYFGGGLQYFFGKVEQDEMRRKPEDEYVRRRAPLVTL